jgi:O-antigen/teichoic acid export membrane protein
MDGLVKSFDIALALMAPFTLIVLFEGNRLVEVFLGPQWLHMVGPMKVLVISFYFKGLCTLIHPLMEGVGKVETRFSFSVLQSLLLFGFLFVLVPKLGAFGAALAALGTYATLCVMFVLWGLIRLRIRLFRFLPALVSVGGATALCALVLMLFHLFGENLNTSLFLMSLTFVGVLYIAVLFLIGRARKTGPAQTLLTILRSVRSQ